MGEIFREKSKTFDMFSNLWSLLIAKKFKNLAVSRIRSNHATKFEDYDFNSFCTKMELNITIAEWGC